MAVTGTMFTAELIRGCGSSLNAEKRAGDWLQRNWNKALLFRLRIMTTTQPLPPRCRKPAYRRWRSSHYSKQPDEERVTGVQISNCAHDR